MWFSRSAEPVRTSVPCDSWPSHDDVGGFISDIVTRIGSLKDTSRVEGVEAPQHLKTPRRCEYAVMGPSVNLAARLMCAAAKSDKDVYVESGIERATSVSPQARLCVFNACEPIKAKGFSEMVKVRDLGVPSCGGAFTPSRRLVAIRRV